MKRLLCGTLTAMFLALPVFAQSSGTATPSSGTPAVGSESAPMNQGSGTAPGSSTTTTRKATTTTEEAQMQQDPVAPGSATPPAPATDSDMQKMEDASSPSPAGSGSTTTPDAMEDDTEVEEED